MIEGILYVLIWWVLILAIGLTALPITRRFFTTFEDRGYALTKGVGLILLCYVNWILCSLHILRFSVLSLIISWGLIAVAAFFLRSESWTDLKQFFMNQRSTVIGVELMFLIAFLVFALIRMCNPDIASTEKFPDFAFLNGILGSHHFPPRDPWWIGESINYFYYGHYQIALLTKLSGFPTAVTYNLGISVLFALTLTGAFGITYGLTKRLKYGFFGGLFVAFIGNLDGIFQVLNRLSDVIFGNSSFFPLSWFNWWASSRVIVREGVDITINEFPFWSYILGDLHAHVNVVPFSLVVLAMILELFRSSRDGLDLMGSNKEWVLRLVLLSIALGAIPAANTWDTPTYFFLAGAGLMYGRQLYKSPRIRSFGAMVVSPVRELWSDSLYETTGPGRLGSVFKSYGMIIVSIALALGLYLPFHLNFHPVGAQGVRFVRPIQWTLFTDFFTIYGFFFFCLVSYLVIRIWPFIRGINERLRPIIGGFTLIILVAVGAATQRIMIPLCLFLLVLILLIPFDPKDKDAKETFFVLALFLMVLAILLGCEFFYIKDAYGKSLERQNTIFKFYYQAWIFCGVASAYAVYWLRERSSGNWKNWWEISFRFLFICTLAFPIFGTTAKCNNFASLLKPGQYSKMTLEGIWYMSWRFPGDYAAIKYLDTHATRDDNLLEATGPAFSHYSRISAATGLGTILGWGNHENIWRDGTWQTVGVRTREVETLYNSSDLREVQDLLKKYGIDYVFIGKLEREKYPNGDFDKFSRFMKPVVNVTGSDGKPSILYYWNP